METDNLTKTSVINPGSTGYVSKLLEEKHNFSVLKHPEPFEICKESIYSFLNDVIKERQKYGVFIDERLWKYFEKFEIKTIHGFKEDFTSTLYIFLKCINHEEILNEAKNIGAKKIKTFLESLSTIRQSILNGDYIQRETARFDYFEFNSVKYRFDVRCRPTGLIRFDVDIMRDKGECNPGDGVYL